MEKILFRLEREKGSSNVMLTMKGSQEDLAAMIFAAMEGNPAVTYLLLKTVTGYCAVNKLSMAAIEQNFNQNI